MASRSPSWTAAPDLSLINLVLPCVVGTARSRGRGASGGARESRRVAGYAKTDIR